jgi:hypothetical protein
MGRCPLSNFTAFICQYRGIAWVLPGFTHRGTSSSYYWHSEGSVKGLDHVYLPAPASTRPRTFGGPWVDPLEPIHCDPHSAFFDEEVEVSPKVNRAHWTITELEVHRLPCILIIWPGARPELNIAATVLNGNHTLGRNKSFIHLNPKLNVNTICIRYK